MAKKQHIAKPGNTGQSAQRAKCGSIMIPGMKVTGDACKRCEDIDAREHRSWLNAREGMWRRANELWSQDGKPRVVIGEFDSPGSLQIVSARFNCATDGPRFVQACGACYAIGEDGQRLIPDAIECTKSELRAKLGETFMGRIVDPAEYAEMAEEIEAIETRANNHRGIYREHNAYLGADITAAPDALPQRPGCSCALTSSEDNHEKGCALGLDLLNTVTPDETKPVCGFCKRADCDGVHFGRQVDNMRQAATPDETVKPISCMYCTERFATVEESMQHGHLNGTDLVGTPYAPSAAIRAMLDHAIERNHQGARSFTRFLILVEGIRAERPDWSDVQARDWLRNYIAAPTATEQAQLDGLVCHYCSRNDVPATQINAEGTSTCDEHVNRRG